MTLKLKLLALGLLIGVVLAFPMGMNFGRNEPLLSNPLREVDVQEEVTAKVKESAETVICFTRALIANPRILILDEATSSVDTETEYKIQEAMERLTSGRTVFAIAHRLSTLRRASRLFVIEDGCLTEQGTHRELLGRSEGTYRRLYELQRELTGAGLRKR